MPRKTGEYRITRANEEAVRAFIPYPLPPSHPPLRLDGDTARALGEATASLGKLEHSYSVCSVYPQWRKQFIASEAVTRSSTPCIADHRASPVRQASER
ncbi:MAG: hypothetical protein K8S99_11075, partial [Planctomycetes bacterium]|nr:hypothetical protein [Planctomycetota bacterium]